MTAPVIRPMCPADLDQAAAIEATALDAWSRSALAEELETALSGGTARVYTALVQDQVAGLAAFQLAAGEASLNTITVAPALRGSGVGRALLTQALQDLKAQGAEACFLEVREKNAPALALYTRLGFVAAGRRRGFYRDPPEDALVMRLELGSQPQS